MKSMKWTHSHSDPRTSAQTETEIYTGKKITIFQLGLKGEKRNNRHEEPCFTFRLCSFIQQYVRS